MFRLVVEVLLKYTLWWWWWWAGLSRRDCFLRSLEKTRRLQPGLLSLIYSEFRLWWLPAFATLLLLLLLLEIADSVVSWEEPPLELNSFRRAASRRLIWSWETFSSDRVGGTWLFSRLLLGKASGLTTGICEKASVTTGREFERRIPNKKKACFWCLVLDTDRSDIEVLLVLGSAIFDEGSGSWAVYNDLVEPRLCIIFVMPLVDLVQLLDVCCAKRCLLVILLLLHFVPTSSERKGCNKYSKRVRTVGWGVKTLAKIRILVNLHSSIEYHITS